MGLTIGQSRKMWRMDSGEFLQRGQEESVRIFLWRRRAFVERLSWQASQRKFVIQGRVGNFQSHFQQGWEVGRGDQG